MLFFTLFACLGPVKKHIVDDQDNQDEDEDLGEDEDESCLKVNIVQEMIAYDVSPLAMFLPFYTFSGSVLTLQGLHGWNPPERHCQSVPGALARKEGTKQIRDASKT